MIILRTDTWEQSVAWARLIRPRKLCLEALAKQVMLARYANVRISERGDEREEGSRQRVSARGGGLTVPADRVGVGKAN
jgi:hypothetical protein